MLIFNKYCGVSNKQESFFQARVIQVELSIGLILNFLDSKIHDI